jgi:hypothetical protein
MHDTSLPKSETSEPLGTDASKTAAPSRDGLAVKGKTKGKMV